MKLRDLASLVVAAAVGFGVSGTAEAIPSPLSWCAKLSTQPGYTYSYQGSYVVVPRGAVMLAELIADGLNHAEREPVCATLVKEYQGHTKTLVRKPLHASPPRVAL